MKRRKSENKKLLKRASEFRPFDYGFLLSIEKQALIQMANYFETSEIAYGNDAVFKDLKLALKLLDIVIEEDSAWHSNGGPGWVDRYINTNNWKRFLPSVDNLELNKPIIQDHLRREKAWYIYNKLKYYRMRAWWD